MDLTAPPLHILHTYWTKLYQAMAVDTSFRVILFSSPF